MYHVLLIRTFFLLSFEDAMKMLFWSRGCVDFEFVHVDCGNAQRASRRLLISSVLSRALSLVMICRHWMTGSKCARQC